MEPKQYSLKWNNFHKNLLKEFESMQNNEELADVTLTCEGINLKAHKFILSACSPYFRTVFKENPCPHPIVILKDILHVDLIAIITYMYHGEVMVSEDNLTTFMETAVILQVSGLASPNAPNKRRPEKSAPAVPKKQKINTNFEQNKCKNQTELKASPRTETGEQHTETLTFNPLVSHEIIGDDSNEFVEKPENQVSILEAALENKPIGSILERSLTSYSTLDKPNTLTTQMDVPKTVFIPRKPPETEGDNNHPVHSSPESSPSSFDRPSEILQQTIKIENEDLYELTEVPIDDSKHPGTIQAHHSSQCGTCPHCGKVYSNQSALKYHVRLVHSDLTNMFCCHLCPEAFDYREGFKKHMVDVHFMRN